MKIPELSNLQWFGVYLIALSFCISVMLTFQYETVHIVDALELFGIALIGLIVLWYESNRLDKKVS